MPVEWHALDQCMRVIKVRNLLWMAGLCSAGVAHADFIGNLGSIAAPVSVAFSNSTATNLALHSGSASLDAPYNFVDKWVFDLANSANVLSLVAAFKFDKDAGGLATFGIGNIQVNLLDVTSSIIVSGWQTVSTSIPFTTTVSITPVAGLSPGPYSLQVRGTLIADPGAYSGSLIAAAPTVVPLPAALPMLMLGLSALGATGVRRRRSAAASSMSVEARDDDRR